MNPLEIARKDHSFRARMINELQKQKEKQMKPDDIISVDMTALEWMKMIPLLGKRYGYANDISPSPYDIVKTAVNVSDDILSRSLEKSECFDCNKGSKLTKEALAQFKDPKQDEIDQLEKTINDAAAKLARLKGE